jgi:hypothetical protein
MAEGSDLILSTITILQWYIQNRASICRANGRGTRINGDGTLSRTKESERLTKEREEIAARVAGFRAIQEKFKREREDYFATTLGKALCGDDARSTLKNAPFWS